MGRHRDDVLDREHPRNAGRSLQEVHEAGNGWLGCRGSGSGRGPGDRSVPTRESETCYWLVIRQLHPEETKPDRFGATLSLPTVRERSHGRIPIRGSPYAPAGGRMVRPSGVEAGNMRDRMGW